MHVEAVLFYSHSLRFLLSTGTQDDTCLTVTKTRVIQNQTVSIPDFTGDKDHGGDSDTRYAKLQAPVKSAKPVEWHPAIYRMEALLVTQPTVSENRR